MRGRSRQIEHLQSVRLFSTLSKKDLTTIAKSAEEITVPAGHQLVTEGEDGREAYILMQGEASVRRNGKKLTTLGSGEIIGELALLDKAPRTASVVCETECTLLLLDRVHFMALLEATPSLTHKFLQTLAGRLRDLDREYYG
jgi:CRP/FNR family cyclic AMP-dependent transcriptional regulator